MRNVLLYGGDLGNRFEKWISVPHFRGFPCRHWAMKGRRRPCAVWGRMLWKVKASDSWFGYVLVILLNIAEVFAKTVAKLSSCFANVQLLAKGAGNASAEVHEKRSVIWMDRLGPDILSVLRMKGQVLQRARAHWKVPGSVVISALLMRCLLIFLSRYQKHHLQEF